MFDTIGLLAAQLFEIYSGLLIVLAVLALIFTVLAVFASQSCDPSRRWWRNPELATDIGYAIGTTLMQHWHLLGLPAMALIYGCLSGFMSPAEIKDYIANGHGPLAGIGFWWQVAIQLVLTDFFLYWIHRGFHGAALWRFHAIHHSPVEVDWHTAFRFHPVNLALGSQLVGLLMLTLGISPEVPVFLIVWEILSAAVVHANLNWTFGPFRYVLAGPVFHRWHHGPANDGGSSNFAPTFAFWDFLFGTFYMPEGRLPEKFGVDDPNFPKSYFGQMLYPFLPQRPAAGTAAVPGGPAA